MSKAKLGDPTDFSYRVNKVVKVVDGDTIDVLLDLGFDIMYNSRVRLFGIDTPESRTSDKVEKKYGMLSKKFLKECSYLENAKIFQRLFNLVEHTPFKTYEMRKNNHNELILLQDF